MSRDCINVRMLGGFSIFCGGTDYAPIDISGRSRRIWSLIEYLIIHRSREVAVTELVEVLWPEEERQDPLNTLQHNVSRARDMLEKHGIPEARNLIISRNNSYRWNPKIETVVDAEEFEHMAEAAANEPDETKRLVLAKEALSLYKGDFLPGAGHESWVIPISAYYRSAYIGLCLSAVRILWAGDRWGEIVALCEPVMRIVPESEEICNYFIRSLTALDQPREALAVYERMRKLLGDTLGVVLSDDLEMAREEASRKISGEKMNAEVVKTFLKESQYGGGALFCDYATFRNLVRMQARMVKRSGADTQLLIVTLDGSNYAATTDNKRLERVLSTCLRTGDAFTRLNAEQYLAMLPLASSENTKAVIERLNNAFSRFYPRSRARIRYEYYQLEQIEIQSILK